MQQIYARKSKIVISKRFVFNIAILFLFLSFGCGLSVAQAEPVIFKNNNPTYPVAVSISVVEGVKPLEVVFSAEEVDITRYFPGTYSWNFDDGTIKEGTEVHHVYEYGALFSPSVKVRFSNGHDEIVPLPKITVLNVLNEEAVIETPTPTRTLPPTRTPTPTPTPESTLDEISEETMDEVLDETVEETANEVVDEISEEAVTEVPEETPTPAPTATPTPQPTPTPTWTPTPVPTPDPTEGFSVVITPNKNRGPTPVQIRFTSITEGGVPLAWKWDFGDGQRSTVEKPAHNYGSPGEYVVQLSVQFLGPVWVDAEPIVITVA